MLDVRFWGMNAGMHLLTGVLLHVLSTILLFLALRKLTRAPWESAFVAALFAIHPMHVESVAWASERKDTLSTLFAMLALGLYARAPRRMVGVSIALALSLAAKQMYITLPFVLLLLDVWPLKRLGSIAELRQRIVEKWPLFVLTIAGALAAFIGQRSLNAVQSTTSLPIADRIANALIAYATYVGKLFVPIDMALPYPLTRVPFTAAIVPLIVLIAITIAVLAARRTAPHLALGWFWFLGTLIPVIGIVAIGNESMADRYTYFSYVGLFIAIVFGAVELAHRVRVPEAVLAVAATAVVIVLSTVTSRQLSYWKDSETLFTHTLAVTRDNPVAEYTLGQALQTTRPDDAIPHLERAIALTQSLQARPNATRPDWFPQAYVGIGNAKIAKAGTLAQSPARETLIRDAVASYRQALTIDPNAPHAAHNIEVAAQIMPSVTLSPSLQADYDAYLNEGTAFSQQGQMNEAVEEFRHAVALAPRAAEAHVYLALGLLQANRHPEGLAELQTAKSIDAKQANDILSKALHLPANDGNLDAFIAQAAR
jgi:tetratricopeptide (TPR) repeat protein